MLYRDVLTLGRDSTTFIDQHSNTLKMESVTASLLGQHIRDSAATHLDSCGSPHSTLTGGDDATTSSSASNSLAPEAGSTRQQSRSAESTCMSCTTEREIDSDAKEIKPSTSEEQPAAEKGVVTEDTASLRLNDSTVGEPGAAVPDKEVPDGSGAIASPKEAASEERRGTPKPASDINLSDAPCVDDLRFQPPPSSNSRGASTKELFESMTVPQIRRRLAILSKEQLLELAAFGMNRHEDLFAAGEALLDSDPASRRVMVRGLWYYTTDRTFKQYFSQFGELENAAVIRHPDGRSQGYGFLIYKEREAAQTVISQRHMVDRRAVTAKLAADQYTDFSRDDEGSTVSFERRKLFVRNICSDITQEILEAEFSAYGPVEECAIIRTAVAATKGYGFVTFKDAASAQRAAQVPFRIIRGWVVFVTFSTGKARTPPPPGLQAGAASTAASTTGVSPSERPLAATAFEGRGSRSSQNLPAYFHGPRGGQHRGEQQLTLVSHSPHPGRPGGRHPSHRFPNGIPYGSAEPAYRQHGTPMHFDNSSTAFMGFPPHDYRPVDPNLTAENTGCPPYPNPHNIPQYSADAFSSSLFAGKTSQTRSPEGSFTASHWSTNHPTNQPVSCLKNKSFRACKPQESFNCGAEQPFLSATTPAAELNGQPDAAGGLYLSDTITERSVRWQLPDMEEPQRDGSGLSLDNPPCSSVISSTVLGTLTANNSLVHSELDMLTAADPAAEYSSRFTSSEGSPEASQFSDFPPRSRVNIPRSRRRTTMLTHSTYNLSSQLQEEFNSRNAQQHNAEMSALRHALQSDGYGSCLPDSAFSSLQPSVPLGMNKDVEQLFERHHDQRSRPHNAGPRRCSLPYFRHTFASHFDGGRSPVAVTQRDLALPETAPRQHSSASSTAMRLFRCAPLSSTNDILPRRTDDTCEDVPDRLDYTSVFGDQDSLTTLGSLEYLQARGSARDTTAPYYPNTHAATTLDMSDVDLVDDDSSRLPPLDFLAHLLTDTARLCPPDSEDDPASASYASPPSAAA